MSSALETIKLGWFGLCPSCKTGRIYKEGITLDLREKCPECGLDLSKNDSADGPAVFLIFILGFALVPMAIVLDMWLAPPLWIHVLLWGVIGLGAILASLRPLKAYIIALQFKHRPGDWED